MSKVLQKLLASMLPGNRQRTHAREREVSMPHLFIDLPSNVLLSLDEDYFFLSWFLSQQLVSLKMSIEADFMRINTSVFTGSFLCSFILKIDNKVEHACTNFLENQMIYR